ncbi:MAG: SigB/SigF/SigG family RNA polymerase sigma factor [Sciscionella sp.]
MENATIQGTEGQKDDGQDQNGYQRLTPLFVELADPSVPAKRRHQVRDQLVTEYLSVATHIAQRFRQRGQPLEDLNQVAALGLINAVDRFDPSRGKDFMSFAVPTITGEVRRYFRDHGWAMRVPRRLKELRNTINSATTQLGHDLGRAPTANELAEYLGVDVEEVHEGLQVSSAYRTASLDELSSSADHSSSTVDDIVGFEDMNLSSVDDRVLLHPTLATLSERERVIVWLRFFDHMTQSQIAEKIGVSQMHVSRLLAKSLNQLRQSLGPQEIG